MQSQEKDAIATYTISQLSDLQSWAINCAAKLCAPSVMFLYGPLGVGKTQLVQFLVKHLGGPNASSPTFVLHQEYPIRAINKEGHWLYNVTKIDHIDLYRIKNHEELENIGFWELFNQPKALVLIEWANRLCPFPTQKQLPPSISRWIPKGWQAQFVQIQFQGHKRELKVWAN